MMLMKVAVAHLVRKFIFSTPYKAVADIRLRQEGLLDPVDGYPLQLQSRDGY